ncbi:hypothetical protein ABXT08_19795 [Chryseobacterium sp. NRRL B-14859]|uniref:hypothetical protein n=1 Tax=Chryseobacterium sp. NRRL B-14859 TaxID=1562763 RepID=UPI0033926746
MKNKFISKLFLLAIIINLISCRNNELLTDHETYNNSSQFKLTTKTIRLEQSKHKLALDTELQKTEINLQKFKANNAFGKTINYANGVSIDTNNITYIENGPNFYTYTFNLVRENEPDDTPVENLVLVPLSDGTYKELLVTYNLTQEEQKDILSGKGVDTNGKVSVTELAQGTYNGNGQLGKAAVSCGWKDETIWEDCSEHVHNQSNWASWGECKADVPPRVFTVMTYRCMSSDDGTGNGGAGSSGGGSTGGAGSGSTGGGTGNCNGTGVATGPLQPGLSTADGNPCTGIPTTPTLSTFFKFVNKLPLDLKTLINDTSNKEFYDGLKEYYDASSGNDMSKNIIKWALEYKQNNSVAWEQLVPMVEFANNFITENPDTLNPEQIFTRQKDLNDKLLQNSNLLLDIPCSELDDWKTIAQHNVPQSVKDKLQNIKNQTSWWSNWQITNLDDGAGAKINMDLFPIQINSLPNKPNSTQKYTPEEFFNFFRLNLNLFAEKFTPIVDNYYGINDTALWNSSNPLGTLIHIEIPIDNGTVICSGFGPKAWVFSTIKAPISMGYDGVHPVSGNRLFGYYVNQSDNTMYIYTRGVDRVSQVVTSSPNLANYLIETSAFFGADQLWKGMQDKLSKYINDRGGNAIKLTEKTYRPNYIKVKNYLKGKAPLSSLGCN